MNQSIASALELGKRQGYLTFHQLNELMPEEVTPDRIDQLLMLLEEAGIELLDESPTNPTAPVLMPRFHRVPGFKERLGSLGIACADCVCYLDAERKVQSAKIIVPGMDAIPAWRRLRQHWPESGFWPIISVYRWDRMSHSEFVEETLPPGSQWIDWVDTVARERHAQDLIDKAGRCGNDPRTFHRWHRGALESLSADELEELCHRRLQTPIPESPDVFGAESPFHLHRDALTDKPSAWVTIHLVPVPQPWQVFAYCPIGGWNGAPLPEEQLAMHRYWHELYGCELVAKDIDSYEMYVPHPPQTRTGAVKLVREVTGFGEETIFSRAKDVDEMIALAQSSHYWEFWWD